MKNVILFLLLLLSLLFSVGELLAQENGLTLRLRRDFGYGAGVQIRGTFSYRVSGPDNLERVVFLLDGEPIGEVSEEPFHFQFHTENYSLGIHTLSAIGYTSSGAELRSNVLQREFVSSSQANNVVLWIIVPIVVITLVGGLIASWATNRNQRKDGKPAISGILGGAICTNCGLPFAIHFWSIKLVVARLDRCPHCGRWQMVHRATQEMLEAAAKEDERATAVSAPSPTPEKKLRDQLDDSRFEDS